MHFYLNKIRFLNTTWDFLFLFLFIFSYLYLICCYNSPFIKKEKKRRKEAFVLTQPKKIRKNLVSDGWEQTFFLGWVRTSVSYCHQLNNIRYFFFLSSFEKKKLDIIFLPFCKRGENEFFKKLYQHCLPLRKKKKKNRYYIFFLYGKGVWTNFASNCTNFRYYYFLSCFEKKRYYIIGKGVRTNVWTNCNNIRYYVFVFLWAGKKNRYFIFERGENKFFNKL